MTKLVLLPIILLACGDEAHRAADADADAEAEADAIAEVEVADEIAVEIDVAVEDAAAEAELGPAPDPEVQGLSLDWAIQSSQSAGASLLYPTPLAFADGSLGVFATFDGTMRFGAHEIVSDDVGYTHVAFARVDPDGAVGALRWVCDRCLGKATELPDGALALAAVVEGEVVLAPGTDEEVRFDAERDLIVVLVDRDGRLLRYAVIARMPGYGSVDTVVATADGALVIAGNAMGLELADGPGFVPEEGWHYPGRAFVVGVDADLRPWFAEQVGGKAGSTINLVHLDGDTLVTVGDFGGYPRGVSTIFGDGDDAIDLPSVSSDDDPAMDIFVARWRLPARDENVARPAIEWVRRIANYSNGPRDSTWIRVRDGRLEWRIDGANRMRAEDGHYVTPYVSDFASLVVAVDDDGAIETRFSSPSQLEPAGDGFVSLGTSWPGSTIAPAGELGPSFPVPADTAPDGLSHQGHALARWRPDGALIAAGLLLQRHDRSYYGLSAQAVMPAADGSVMVMLHGSAPITLVPSAGDEVVLEREPGYERLVIIRARLNPN